MNLAGGGGGGGGGGAVVAVTDYQPLALLEPAGEVKSEEAQEIVQLEAFRYIFKRPAA